MATLARLVGNARCNATCAVGTESTSKTKSVRLSWDIETGLHAFPPGPAPRDNEHAGHGVSTLRRVLQRPYLRT